MIPVFVDGCLAITDQADASLHEGPDIEMVALSSSQYRTIDETKVSGNEQIQRRRL